MKNRFGHSLTRWPVDPARRLEAAITDCAFCKSMVIILGRSFWNPETLQFYERARKVELATRREMELN